MKFGSKMYGAKEAHAAKTSAKTHDKKMRSAALNKSEDKPKKKKPITSGPKDFPPIVPTDDSPRDPQPPPPAPKK
jgi:hypothetical protein